MFKQIKDALKDLGNTLSARYMQTFLIRNSESTMPIWAVEQN